MLRTVHNLAQYRVVLHNDPHVGYCIARWAVRDIMRFSEDRSDRHVMEAHEQGTSTLCITHQERAEFLQEKFASNPSIAISVEIEPLAV